MSKQTLQEDGPYISVYESAQKPIVTTTAG